MKETPFIGLSEDMAGRLREEYRSYLSARLDKLDEVKPLEKAEIARLFDLSPKEFYANIQPIALQIGWKKRRRQKIQPMHFKVIFMHFFGEEIGWIEFFSKKA